MLQYRVQPAFSAFSFVRPPCWSGIVGGGDAVLQVREECLPHSSPLLLNFFGRCFQMHPWRTTLASGHSLLAAHCPPPGTSAAGTPPMGLAYSQHTKWENGRACTKHRKWWGRDAL